MKRQAGSSDAGPLAVEGVIDGVPIPISGSISGGNAAASATGAAVPSDADYQGVNVGGTLRGVTGVSPTGSVVAEQVDIASIGGNAVTTTIPVSLASAPTTSVTQGTSPWVVGQGTATNLKTQAEAYQGGSAVASGNPLQVTLANTGANATAVKVDGSAVTQPISGTVTATVSTSALTASSPAVASVGVASAQAVAANASRKGLVLVNLSSSNISFGIGATAVLGSGITLVPNGVWEMDQFTLSVAAINAIAGAASSSLSVQEFA